MSEPTKNPVTPDSTPIPLEIIEKGTTVSIEVTDELYKRIQDIIMNYLPFKDMEHFTNIIKQINSGTYSDPICGPLHTLLTITNLFEDAAKVQGKITKKNWDPITKTVTEV